LNDGTPAVAATDFSVGATARQVITQAACDGCHAGLTAHGGHWRAVTQCVLCHQPQSSDPDTGNTVDFKVMVHKIHDGASLPSVVAGGRYHIVGYQQSDNDFSTVEFPQAINRCEACHATNATQASSWMTQPSIATCTSCHDTTSFDATPPAGMVAHSGGPRTDGQCLVCHADNSIYPVRTAHYRGVLDPTAPQIAVTIDSITGTAPGASPAIAFTVTTTTNGATTPTNILTAPIPRLRVTFAGPNTDYATFWQANVQGSGANGTLAAVTDGSDGKFVYTVPASAAIPATATGSYTVGMEGYLQDAAGNRLPMENPVLAFAVTDPQPVPRREVVTYAACNSCHATLNHHGPDGQGARRDPKYCVMCHNANNTGNGTTRYQGQTVLAQSVDFKGLIHGIHMGELRSTPLSWVSGASQTTPGGAVTTWPTQYPRDQGSCTACHQGTTFTLPLDASLLPAIDQELTCGVDTAPGTGCPTANWPVVTQTIATPAESEACLGCHDAPYTAVHAALNTTTDGRTACATCHGPGMVEDVAVVHKVD
jgi:OmcA/MtrC family decaheme c-type cytochrome